MLALYVKMTGITITYKYQSEVDKRLSTYNLIGQISQLWYKYMYSISYAYVHVHSQEHC